MFVRLNAAPEDSLTVRVAFSADGQERVVLVEDGKLASQMIVNRQNIKAANDLCQAECVAAAAEFDRLGKEAEAEYQRRAAELREIANAKIATAQAAQVNGVALLTETRDELTNAAFRAAELQLIAEAKNPSP